MEKVELGMTFRGECPSCHEGVCITKRERWRAHYNGFGNRCEASGKLLTLAELARWWPS